MARGRAVGMFEGRMGKGFLLLDVERVDVEGISTLFFGWCHWYIFFGGVWGGCRKWMWRVGVV